jgi:hypothetical protein
MARKLSQFELKFKWTTSSFPTFEGRSEEDPQAWLTGVDSGCQLLDIPVSQRMLTAIHFLRGPLKLVMKTVKGHLESLRQVRSCIEKWDAFRATLMDLHGDSYCYLYCLALLEHFSTRT